MFVDKYKWLLIGFSDIYLPIVEKSSLYLSGTVDAKFSDLNSSTMLSKNESM